MKSLLLLSLLTIASFFVAASGNFYQDVTITWGNGRAKILDGGNLMSLSLDKDSGSGFQANNDCLFGRFDVQLKLVPGDSAGTVTTFYLSSLGPNHDEVDFEFLGNVSGSPYTLHTNVFTDGKGNREQGFKLWFDPTKDFHTYSIIWNPHRIIWYVDYVPIRVFENLESIGIPYASHKPMMLYATIWDADSWATMGGRVKADWSKAPFTAYYRNFNMQTTKSSGNKAWLNQGLGPKDRGYIRWAQRYHMIYNYCNNANRRGMDRRECLRSRFF